MDDKLICIPNVDKQNYPCCRFKSLVEKFGINQFWVNQSKFGKSTQSFCIFIKRWVPVDFNPSLVISKSNCWHLSMFKGGKIELFGKNFCYYNKFVILMKTIITNKFFQFKTKFFGNSPFRYNDPEGAFRIIFKMAFDRLFQVRLGYIGLGDCPALLGNFRGQKYEESYCENQKKLYP